ncbi:unnamed protein product [Rhodiola kirilowii]
MSFSVGIVSHFMEKPTSMHMQAVKHILRYLKGTQHYGLTYAKGSNCEELVGFSDSDNMAGDLDDRRSTTELMAATSAASQALWLRNLLSELVGEEPKPVTIYVDNKSAIALMKNPVFHGRSKHIDTRHHFIRECVERGQIKVEHVSSG